MEGTIRAVNLRKARVSARLLPSLATVYEFLDPRERSFSAVRPLSWFESLDKNPFNSNIFLEFERVPYHPAQFSVQILPQHYLPGL